MALLDRFKRQPKTEETETETTPATTEYPIETAEPEPAERNWLMLGALGLTALAIAILVVLGGRWAYHKTHKPYLAPASTKSLPKPPPTDLKPSSAGNVQMGSGTRSVSAQNAIPATGG